MPRSSAGYQEPVPFSESTVRYMLGWLQVTKVESFIAIIIVLKRYPIPCLNTFKRSIHADTLKKHRYATISQRLYPTHVVPR
jgi:hypothetical protein